jgi:hypothetical protein
MPSILSALHWSVLECDTQSRTAFHEINSGQLSRDYRPEADVPFLIRASSSNAMRDQRHAGT